MIRQYELVERVKAYDPHIDENLLNKAYVFSMKVHGTQKRASGDSYFSHPLEVAGILTGMQLDCATIITALLHDTIEDTVATEEQIEDLFGKEIARLVDGVTKLSELEYSKEYSKQAENFRKFLIAMSNDIRVLLVKLADRLHNMRTLHFISKPEKRERIARETLDIYAPLAERIGMQEIKEELETLSFPHVYPDAYESIIKRLDYLHANTEDVRQQVILELESLFKEAGIEAEVKGRSKKPYSIWRKMTYRSVNMEDQADIVAFRIVVDKSEDCYSALGLVHQKWQSIPGFIKDYISTPKANGYQSIHTQVIGPQQKRIEIQIRSSHMDMVAEKGVAAHWSYKQMSSSKEGQQYRWLQDLLEILEHAADPEEFLEHTKIAMYQNTIFCFTPKGELFSLPSGATILDFAYAVHTKVGESCVGGKINGKDALLQSRLSNGDQVEILRSAAQKPVENWLTYAKTGKAKAAIRRYIRQKVKDKFIARGRILIEKAHAIEERDFSEKAIIIAAEKMLFEGPDIIYEKLGAGEIFEMQVMEVIFPGLKFEALESLERAPLINELDLNEEGLSLLPIYGFDETKHADLSPCCFPIPGDRIIGLTENDKIHIHTINCDVLALHGEENWLDLSWHEDAMDLGVYVGRIVIKLDNETGALSSVLGVVSQEYANINNIKFMHKNIDFLWIEVDIEIKDVKHLNNIIAALKVNDRVLKVERYFDQHKVKLEERSMNKEDVLKYFKEAGALLEGHFLLSSGLHSPLYLQCARILMNPLRAEKLCCALADKIRKQIDVKIDLVVSPAMGGVIVGYEMGRQLGVDAIFTERAGGKFLLRRGFEIPKGANILMAEDIVTTGLSSRECIEVINDLGGNVVAASCLVDRSDGKVDVGVPLISLMGLEIPVFEENNLPSGLAKIKAIKPGSRALKK